MTHLEPESPAEDSRHSWQVADFQHLLLARSNVTLHSTAEQGGNASERVCWKDGSHDRRAEKNRQVLPYQKTSDNITF